MKKLKIDTFGSIYRQLLEHSAVEISPSEVVVPPGYCIIYKQGLTMTTAPPHIIIDLEIFLCNRFEVPEFSLESYYLVSKLDVETILGVNMY